MRPTAAKMQSSIAQRASGTQPRRHSLPTVPESELTPSPEVAPVEINKPIWAVDLGSEIRALSTFDLWMGLSRGELSTEVRVWRMGRECWCPAREVPELACALAESVATGSEEPAERVTLDYSARSSNPPSVPTPVTPPVAALDPAVLDAWMAEPLAPLAPPSAQAGAFGTVVREPRRLVRARKIRRHLAAVAAGAAALALAAIGLAAPAAAPSGAKGLPTAPATARPVEPLVDLAAGGRVPAPRARRVSPTHAGQQRHR
jgi:hypothetical protein